MLITSLPPAFRIKSHERRYPSREPRWPTSVGFEMGYFSPEFQILAAVWFVKSFDEP